MTDSIFEGNENNTAPVADQAAEAPQTETPAEARSEVASDPYADLLKGIATDDGRPKYATVSDALNSIPHAQKHIASLEQELAELRSKYDSSSAELERAKSLEETVANLQAKTEAPPQANPEDLAGLIDKVLHQRESESMKKSNVANVVDVLTQKFGDAAAADKAYRDKAAELGIGMEMMNSIAATSPKAMLAYFGDAGAAAPSKTDHGTINTAAMPTTAKTEKGANPLLSGSMADMQAEWNRIKKELNL